MTTNGKFDLVLSILNESKLCHNILNYKFYNKPITKKDLDTLIEIFIKIEKNVLEERYNFKSVISVDLINEGFDKKSIWLGGDADYLEEGIDQPCLMIEPSLSINPKASFIDIDNPIQAITKKIERVFETFLYPLVDGKTIIAVSDSDRKIIPGGYDKCIAVIKEGSIFGLLNYGYDKNYSNGSIWLTAFCSNPLDFSLD